MKERKLWKKTYLTYNYLSKFVWVTERELYGYNYEIGDYGYFIRPAQYKKVKDYQQKIVCIDNNWEYQHEHYCRRVQTTQERRYYIKDQIERYDENYKFKLRAKRSNHMLPNVWDDYWIHPVRSWKKTHKVKKQWMKNL